MAKKQWKTVAVSVITLILLSLLVFRVFRDHYQAILLNIRAVSIPELLLLPGRRLTGVDRGISRCLLPGYGICALIIAVLLLLCTSSRVQSLVSRGIDRLPDTKKRRERKRMWKENLAALYTESQQLLRDGRCSVKALIWNALKLFCLCSIPFLAMRMLRISGPDFWQVQRLTALMYLISSALPNVAGMGPVEFAFILLFSQCMEYAQASSVLILYRTATFFFPFILSIFVFLSAQKRLLNGLQKD